jgi:hypothetical protein
MGGVLEADHCIRLGTFLTLDDIELDVIALFQRFVPVQLNRRVVDEYIRPVFASDESIALGVVEPLYLPFVLGHRLLLSLGLGGYGERGIARRYLYDEKKGRKVGVFCARISTK